MNLLKKQLLLAIILMWASSLQIAVGANNCDEDALISIANWAPSVLPSVFDGEHSAPFKIAGYNALHFEQSNAYIGIKDGFVDVLADAFNGLVRVGTVNDVYHVMQDSRINAIKLSGLSVESERLSLIYSPGKGKSTIATGTILSIRFQKIICKDTDKQVVDTLEIIPNAANPSTAANVSYSSTGFAGEDSRVWTSFAFSNDGIAGITIDSVNQQIRFDTEVILMPTDSSHGELILHESEVSAGIIEFLPEQL